MPDASTRIKTVDDYIATAPEKARGLLRELREVLRNAAPHAVENIKWGTPVYEQERILFSFSAHADHVNFMPTRSTLDQFRERLSEYKLGKDTIQFPYGKKLPVTLIKEIADYRIEEVKAGALWMHHS